MKCAALTAAALHRVCGEHRAPPSGEPFAVPGHALVLQEVCAGHGGVTKAWRASGHPAEEPVELYADPDTRTQPRADHDVTRPEVQRRLLAAAADPQGPNVWILEPPCTSFCDFQLLNGGTRTFQEPLGGASGRALTANETVGNAIGTFMARLFGAALKAGKFVLLENQARSGRYPKLWDMPAWATLLRRPDVEAIVWSFCAWGLKPVEGTPEEFHRKRTCAACTKVPGLAVLLGRSCPSKSATHRHVTIEGSRPGSRLTRAQEAGQYPEEFCKGLTSILTSLLAPRDSRAGGPATRAPHQPPPQQQRPQHLVLGPRDGRAGGYAAQPLLPPPPPQHRQQHLEGGKPALPAEQADAEANTNTETEKDTETEKGERSERSGTSGPPPFRRRTRTRRRRRTSGAASATRTTSWPTTTCGGCAAGPRARRRPGRKRRAAGKHF